MPYFLFFLCGIVAWTLFERSLFFITRSVERNRRLVTRVYFPRLILPVAAVAPGLVYLALLLVVLIVTVVFFHQRDGVWYVTLQSATAGVARGDCGEPVVCDCRGAVDVGAPGAVSGCPVSAAVRHAVLVPADAGGVSDVRDLRPVSLAGGSQSDGADRRSVQVGHARSGRLPAGAGGDVAGLVVITMVTGLWFFNREEAASVDKL